MDAKENSIFVAILIIAVILIFILVYFFIGIFRRQQKSIRMYSKGIADEIEQIEKERSRIAADLHDEMAPRLSVVKMRLNSLHLTRSEDITQSAKIKEHISDIMQRLREISFNLMPESLLSRGLAVAVEEYINSLNLEPEMQFNFSGSYNPALSSNQCINTYRIIQEVVQNSIKHARATHLSVEMQRDGINLVVRIADDGIGFDIEKERAENSGFGLRSLLRRAQTINGQMFVESKKNAGTIYQFEIPLTLE